jgi:hypothetical protein
MLERSRHCEVAALAKECSRTRTANSV